MRWLSLLLFVSHSPFWLFIKIGSTASHILFGVSSRVCLWLLIIAILEYSMELASVLTILWDHSSLCLYLIIIFIISKQSFLMHIIVLFFLLIRIDWINVAIRWWCLILLPILPQSNESWWLHHLLILHCWCLTTLAWIVVFFCLLNLEMAFA